MRDSAGQVLKILCHAASTCFGLSRAREGLRYFLRLPQMAEMHAPPCVIPWMGLPVCQELHDSIEQPAFRLAQSGRFAA